MPPPGRCAPHRHATRSLRGRPSYTRIRRGCSSMVEPQPSKLVMRVRFPSPAPSFRPPARSRRLVHRLLFQPRRRFPTCITRTLQCRFQGPAPARARSMTRALRRTRRRSPGPRPVPRAAHRGCVLARRRRFLPSGVPPVGSVAPRSRKQSSLRFRRIVRPPRSPRANDRPVHGAPSSSAMPRTRSNTGNGSRATRQAPASAERSRAKESAIRLRSDFSWRSTCLDPRRQRDRLVHRRIGAGTIGAEPQHVRHVLIAAPGCRAPAGASRSPRRRGSLPPRATATAARPPPGSGRARRCGGPG